MKEYLWVENYRPKAVKECILPPKIRSTFDGFLKQGEIPNLLLSGTAGTGKTTVARALCEELGCDYIMINGSDEGRQIDTLRVKIKEFATTQSFKSSTKVVIIDEADYLNKESVQPAMRAFIEQYSSNCRFIFTCNYKTKLISPLLSRLTLVEFKTVPKERAKLAGHFFNRVKDILDGEGVEYSDRVVAEVINKNYPDFRKTLNELQKYGVDGKIDEGILVDSITSYKGLIENLKEKNWTKMRKWVTDNVDTEPTRIFSELYDVLCQELPSKSIPQVVLLLADYQYKAAFVADQEINMTACLTEIMANVEFS
jgi:DNA polymerase III delta prime subunit